MKAIEFDRYGPPDVLELRDVPVPEIEPGQLLVRVEAAGVNPFDWHTHTGLPYFTRLQAGIRRPKQTRLGADVAGIVEQVGDEVSGFTPGEPVYGGAMGSFGEFVVAAPKSVARRPETLTAEQVAAVPMAALTALQSLRDKGDVAQGTRVLINGASGGVGTFAVQLAKLMGAEVTAVCSGGNADLVRSLGADHVVDYTAEDFTASAGRFDVIIDNVGDKTLRACRRALSRKGIYVMISGPKDGKLLGPARRAAGLISFLFAPQRGTVFVSRFDHDDLEYLAELLDSGRLVPVIERTFTLAETADAIRHVEKGHTRGKVVVTV